MKKKCDCGKGAKWVYGPGFANDSNPFVCDDCVGRGCSCNHRPESYLTEEDGVEGKDWKWVELEEGEVSEHRYWTSIDDKGREWPCAEYCYDIDEDNFSYD